MDKLITCVCIIIIVLLLDMIFGITSIMPNEHFNVNNDMILKSVKSLRSKVDGMLINIDIDDDARNKYLPDDTEINIKIPVDNNENYLDYDGIEISFTSDNKSKWILHKIKDAQMLNKITNGNSNAGYSADKVDKYPFFMVTSIDHKNKVLQYSNGNLLCVSVGNYDSQKWDISDERIPTSQLILKNIYDTPIGQMAKSSSSDNENKIKLNLNFNNEKLKQLFNDTSSNDTPQNCDTYLPKSAVKSLCPGCEY
tara:strand:- start:405 stop:1163 length:759 start_codon:yes stop_codon:yes gene_type:complete